MAKRFQMDMAQIEWLTANGFSVQQLTVGGWYMMVRRGSDDSVRVLLQESPNGKAWSVRTENATHPDGYRTRTENLRACLADILKFQPV